MNIADAITMHARRRLHHPAIEDGDWVVTYAELDTLVDGVAATLQTEGIAPHDVVGVMLPDSVEYLIVLLALARMGAVMAAIDDALPPAAIERAALDAKARTIIAAKEDRAIVGVRIVAVEALLRVAPSRFRRPSLGARHPLMVVESSGTTGRPKSFVWTHARMLVQAARHQRCLGWRWRDRYLALVKMSFFWERELCMVLFRLGATVVVNRAQTLGELIEGVNTECITILALSPMQLGALLDHPADRLPLFPSLRTMLVGSAPLAHERRLLARQRLTPHFHEQLGTNETGLLVLGTPTDQDAHPEAIGRVVDGVEARVIGSDGKPLPVGEVGLVGFRGKGFPAAYADDPQATARAFRDGWFYPGDIAAIDAQGYFFFKGRADDVINNEGAKFYPIEVENALLAHPAIAEAAVLGWPHSRHGEVAIAFVVARKEIAAFELTTFCRERIASHKVPNRIVFVQNLPKTVSGKIVKSRLREMFRDMRKDGAG